MSGSKLGVLALFLLSALILLYGIFLGSFQALVPEAFSVYRDPVTDKIGPGCLGVPVLLFMTFLALLPAVAAFRLWRTRVRARATQARQENEYEHQLEEQLQWAMQRAIDLRLSGRSTGKPGELSEAFVGEVRGLAGLWNRARRERLFRFLSDLGFQGGWLTVGDDVRRHTTSESPDSQWERSQPLAVAAVVGWFSMSFLLLFNALAAGMGMWFSAPTRPGEAVAGSLGCFIPALITGLAGVGIAWLFFQERQASRHRQAARDGVRELILRRCTEALEKLPRGNSNALSSSGVQSVVRALVIAGTAELDGQRRGRLLSQLQWSGWLGPEAGVDLCGANFHAASLGGATLARAPLRRTDLSLADLSRADLQQADLRECNLRECDLRFANLGGADLRGADLRGAKCQQACLASAKLESALLDGAQLWGADLSDTAFADRRSADAEHGGSQ